MACCWSLGFDANKITPVPWVTNMTGWIDFETAIDPNAVFSGRPSFLGGTHGSAAWRIYSNAVSNFAIHNVDVHHHGRTSHLSKLRTRSYGAFGGIAPVAVFVVPDLYVEHYTPNYNNRFEFSSAVTYDFDVTGGERHVSDPIPNEFYWTDVITQLKNQPYYVDFITQRDLGFPNINPQAWEMAGVESPSELDIDIALRWIHFPTLLSAGGFSSLQTWLIDSFGGLCDVEFRVVLPKQDQPLSGWPIPIVFVKYSPWLASAGGTAHQFETVARNARPAPGTRDASIVDGFNRLQPNSNTEEVRIMINGRQLSEDFDFDDSFASDRLWSLMAYRSVQEYSAPSEIQRRVLV